MYSRNNRLRKQSFSSRGAFDCNHRERLRNASIPRSTGAFREKSLLCFPQKTTKAVGNLVRPIKHLLWYRTNDRGAEARNRGGVLTERRRTRRRGNSAEFGSASEGCRMGSREIPAALSAWLSPGGCAIFQVGSLVSHIADATPNAGRGECIPVGFFVDRAVVTHVSTFFSKRYPS